LVFRNCGWHSVAWLLYIARAATILPPSPSALRETSVMRERAVQNWAHRYASRLLVRFARHHSSKLGKRATERIVMKPRSLRTERPLRHRAQAPTSSEGRYDNVNQTHHHHKRIFICPARARETRTHYNNLTLRAGHAHPPAPARGPGAARPRAARATDGRVPAIGPVATVY
jgi:hypothetical protein